MLREVVGWRQLAQKDPESRDYGQHPPDDPIRRDVYTVKDFVDDCLVGCETVE